ncbi:MAG TPA: protein-disulfide reductase DsbD domain-containing protein, partial [Terriglobales bacterium]|nr:protein-disulfide reductase DsbD domain-containing protein [Terriglobales bacterium]
MHGGLSFCWIAKRGGLLGLYAFLSVANAQVSSSLVAADQTVSAGHPFTVALRLQHEPSWHTYWISAGTGYPTSLTWDLPSGWNAGPIQWPVPTTIKDPDGNVTGNGYSGIVDLPVTITPPASLKAGQQITLKAHAKWLMCAERCIPGESSLKLSLPVTSNGPTPNDTVRAELLTMPMPQPGTGWKIYAAKNQDKTVALHIDGLRAIKSPHFFSEDGFVQYDQPQAISQTGGALSLTLPIADDANAETKDLVGVLAYLDGQGNYRGLLIDTSLGSEAVAANTPPSSSSPTGSGLAKATNGQPDPASTLGLSIFLYALLGGLILNLMPCVFPVLGIKVVG